MTIPPGVIGFFKICHDMNGKQEEILLDFSLIRHTFHISSLMCGEEFYPNFKSPFIIHLKNIFIDFKNFIYSGDVSICFDWNIIIGVIKQFNS